MAGSPRYDINEIKKYYDNGCTNRQIAKKIGCHHRTVADYLKKINLESNFYKEEAKTAVTEFVTCTRCKKTQNITKFQYGRKNTPKEYRFSYCNKCRNKQIYLNLNDNLKANLKDKYNRLRRRSKTVGDKFDISFDYFYQQYLSQKGKCFFTDEILDCHVGNGLNPNSFSIDKLIPDKGYIKGNVVFCQHRINSMKRDATLKEMKKWMPDWYNRIIKFLEKQD